MPKRIQRSRSKGWRKPDGAVYVGRGSKWGNPYEVNDLGHPAQPFYMVGKRLESRKASITITSAEKSVAAEYAVQWFKRDIEADPEMMRMIRGELAGRDLMCWCPLDQPCHADVLLEIANGDEQ